MPNERSLTLNFSFNLTVVTSRGKTTLEQNPFTVYEYEARNAQFLNVSVATECNALHHI